MPINILIMGGWSFSYSDLAPLTRAIPGGATVTVLTPADLPSLEGVSMEERFAATVQGQHFDLAIGWSMGGMLILDAVIGGGLDAGSLLLFSTCGRFLQAEDYEHGVLPRLQRAMQMLLQQNPTQCIRDFRDVSSYPNQTDHTESAWTQDNLDEGLSFLAEFDVRNRLSEITQPTLIIHGDLDRVIKKGCAIYLNDHLPNSSLVRVPGAGHDLCIRTDSLQAEWIQQALGATPV